MRHLSRLPISHSRVSGLMYLIGAKLDLIVLSSDCVPLKKRNTINSAGTTLGNTNLRCVQARASAAQHPNDDMLAPIFYVFGSQSIEPASKPIKSGFLHLPLPHLEPQSRLSRRKEMKKKHKWMDAELCKHVMWRHKEIEKCTQLQHS